ncbi:MAG: hypothetical protein JWO85_3068 [Candidatus Eremiobacteraeota bacterium]|nr:hypothetical protein [Candidatus Eremiobacteraeota bacterium]
MIWFAPFAGLGDDVVRPPFGSERDNRPQPPRLRIADRADAVPDRDADPVDESERPHQARASIR